MADVSQVRAKIKDARVIKVGNVKYFPSSTVIQKREDTGKDEIWGIVDLPSDLFDMLSKDAAFKGILVKQRVIKTKKEED